MAPITIKLNGETQSLDHPMPVAELLRWLKIPAGLVVVEHNARILSRGEFGVVSVEDGDRMEIIRFVGGG